MNRKEFMVSAAGFEPATHALKGLPERRISNLYAASRSVTKCYESRA